jgi:histidinol-phosphate aminotransferase
MSHYWSRIVHSLTPYVPGEQPKIANLIKLNTNENPYGPSPRVIEAMQAELGDDLRLYPDPSSDQLRQAIADYYGLELNQVFVGNGSDEVLAHTFQGLLKQDKPLLFPDISYSFYPVYCGLYEVEYQQVPLGDDFAINIDDFLVENGGIIFPNPNAPTGRLLELGKIEILLQKNTESVVVVDEAYIDFGGESAVGLISQYPNLLVIQTVSKSRSLAGIRVGYAMGNADLIEALVRVKDSFNSYPLDRIAIAGATAAIQDVDYFRETCDRVIASREEVTAELERLGFDVIPSAANFIFAAPSKISAQDLADELRERGIIVRYFNKPRIDQYLRITIGTHDQNRALISALQSIIPAG